MNTGETIGGAYELRERLGKSLALPMALALPIERSKPPPFGES